MAVIVDEHNFTVRGHAVAWPSVRRIATYKRDRFAYDEIFLAFETRPGEWVEVSEEDPGFNLLVAEMERRYPDLPRDWFGRVMHPAFQENYRILWRGK